LSYILKQISIHLVF